MNRELYAQYIKGGQESIVWSKIFDLGSLATTEPYIEDVLLVLDACMNRVLNNFITIKNELISKGYIFENFGDINSEYSIIEQNQQELGIIDLQDVVSQYGLLPYSLIYFYKKIFCIDFRGYFSNWDNPFYLDAIYIYSLKAFLKINESPYGFNVEGQEGYQVLISPDELLKENVSGDLGYGLELRNAKHIDSNLIGFSKDISFIDYLRLCFKWSGLVGLEWYEEGEVPSEILEIILDIRRKMLVI